MVQLKSRFIWMDYPEGSMEIRNNKQKDEYIRRMLQSKEKVTVISIPATYVNKDPADITMENEEIAMALGNEEIEQAI